MAIFMTIITSSNFQLHFVVVLGTVALATLGVVASVVTIVIL